MIKIIVATDSNGGIGYRGGLLAKLPNDLKLFKKLTENNVVLMGRKTFDSLPVKPLKNRVNLVVSKIPKKIDDVKVFGDIHLAIRYYKEFHPNKILYVIGGSEIYNFLVENYTIDEFIITEINSSFEADKYFFYDTSHMKKELLLEQNIDDKHQFGFKTYRYY